MLKIYQSTNGQHYFFHLTVDGKEKKIEFRSDRKEYRTDSMAEQSAIENTPLFLSGKIAEVDVTRKVIKKAVADTPKSPTQKSLKAPVMESEEPESNVIPAESGGHTAEAPAKDETPESVLESVEYPDVVDINGAVAVLRGEPYKVHHLKLKTPLAVREQAASNGVVFPNWSTE